MEIEVLINWPSMKMFDKTEKKNKQNKITKTLSSYSTIPSSCLFLQVLRNNYWACLELS